MKARVKVALLLATALLATPAAAVNAQAQSISPPGAVAGIADFPRFEYGGSPIVCDAGMLDGTADGTDRISDVTLAFSGTCDAGGTISAEVACQGTLSLIAIDPFENLATLQPNPGFRCDVTTDLEFEVVNNGSEICGPQFGTGSFSAFYDVSPENLSFDP